MNNVDFISEKWRSCRRTRKLAHIHVASSVFPIIYVALYAEAQRRNGDDKELGAALAALLFNVFQLTRTIMGIVQLNAFVAWCKHAVECIRALSGTDGAWSQVEFSETLQLSELHTDSREEISERSSGGEARELNRLSLFRRIVASFKRGAERMTAFLFGNSEQDSGADAKASEISEDMRVSSAVDDENIEEKIQVNNAVVDNELGGREVTVLLSLKKMWNGLKKGSFEPITWLRTDRVMLNTVRWGGAFLCGRDGQWGASKYDDREDGEILKEFFSSAYELLLLSLQDVEWSIELENGSREILSTDGVGDRKGWVNLTGEMITAYGTGFRRYRASFPSDVGLYSFEFDSLVSSYPTNEDKEGGGNRESVQAELVHSILLAKHLVVEKLKAIRQYYDNYHVPVGGIHKNAFKLLGEQTSSHIPDDAKIWQILESSLRHIPLFPYRMQAVALWDEATNLRVLQASAHEDKWI